MKLVLLLSLALTGCGFWERTIANYTGNSVTCVSGIKVVQMTSGAFWLPDVNGRPISCK